MDLREHPFNANCNANVAEKLGIKKHDIGMKKCCKICTAPLEVSHIWAKMPQPPRARILVQCTVTEILVLPAIRQL